MTHDPRYEKHGYFDNNFDLTNLRMTQQVVGVGTVQAHGDIFVGALRQELLNGVSLFALTCGAGKTILMMAALFAICHEISKRMKCAPRPKTVLWFSSLRELCSQLKAEIPREVTQFGLCEVRPDVRQCDESGDLDVQPGIHVITFSCPHTLWETKDQVRSDEKIIEILSWYDVIIWDECDFAVDQIERLIRLAPHALKFGLTAANIDADGDVLKRFFVLASIASHRTVFEFDHCLCPLLSWDEAKARGYIQPIDHNGYTRWEAAIEVAGQGQHGERHSLPGAMATIRKAIEDADQLDRQNRQAWPDDWYHRQIGVFCTTRNEAIDLCEQTNEYLRNAGYSHLDGWRAVALVSVDKRIAARRGYKIPLEETQLYHKNPALMHPFLKPSSLDGRCDRTCARIVFLVDIGVRGLNHWPWNFIVDLKRSGSVSEQVQTLGRLSRPGRLQRKWQDIVRYEHFCHPRWYFPQAGLDQIGAIKGAWDFVVDMDSRMQAANMFTWRDIAEGKTRSNIGTEQNLAAPFTLMDRLQIDRALNDLHANSLPPSEYDIRRIIAELPGQHSAERDEHAREHIENVLTKPEYKRQLINLKIKKEHMIRPIAMEQPKKPSDYTFEELAAYILHDDETEEVVKQADVEKLKTDISFRDFVARRKRKDDKRLFRQVPKMRQLQKEGGQAGILSDITNDLMGEMQKIQLVNGYSPDVYGNLSAAINNATCMLTGVELGEKCTANNGVLDLPSYHYQFIVPSTVRRIKDLAIALMIHKGDIPSLTEFYRDAINGSNQ
jgi:hypothetical protein